MDILNTHKRSKPQIDRLISAIWYAKPKPIGSKMRRTSRLAAMNATPKERICCLCILSPVPLELFIETIDVIIATIARADPTTANSLKGSTRNLPS